MSGNAFAWVVLAISAVFGVVWAIGLVYIIRSKDRRER